MDNSRLFPVRGANFRRHAVVAAVAGRLRTKTGRPFPAKMETSQTATGDGIRDPLPATCPIRPPTSRHRRDRFRAASTAGGEQALPTRQLVLVDTDVVQAPIDTRGGVMRIAQTQTIPDFAGTARRLARTGTQPSQFGAHIPKRSAQQTELAPTHHSILSGRSKRFRLADGDRRTGGSPASGRKTASRWSKPIDLPAATI